MSLTCLSHTKSCTLQNAFLWGMCASHLRQAKIQSHLVDKIAHIVLAILEAIPLIGQVVSLIELKIIRSLSRPDPISCIPQFETVAYQETEEDICRLWPKDLQLLGLTEEQKEQIDSHLREGFRALKNGGDLTYCKRWIKYGDGGQTVEAALPITLAIYNKREGQEFSVSIEDFSVILLPKTVFASGGERNIRWAYDLTAGKFLLKKRVVGPFETTLVDRMLPLRIHRAIKTSLIFRNSFDKEMMPKTQMIEETRDGALPILLGTAPLADFSVKHDLIVDLLNDLQALHSLPIRGFTLTSNENQQIERSYMSFHSDIKPANVLVFEQRGKWRAELCDFGAAAANPVAFISSFGFTPPEYIRFYEERRPLGISQPCFDNDEEIAEFNINHGQGRDVWSLGLVILTLLVERQEEAAWENTFQKRSKTGAIPPLECFKKTFSFPVYSPYDENGILFVLQEEIEEDLDRLEAEVSPRYPEEKRELSRIFSMLKIMMLRVNPDERKTVAECLAYLKENRC